MKLYVHTSGDEGLCLDVLFTGQVFERHGKIHRAEMEHGPLGKDWP